MGGGGEIGHIGYLILNRQVIVALGLQVFLRSRACPPIRFKMLFVF